MDRTRALFCVGLLIFCTFAISGIAETPFLSSKAVRIALEAKRSIDGHDEGAIQKATEHLEALLHEASFRRLEPQTQVQILLWLSKGYERLGKYQEQERLLTSYSKKLELYRFHTMLQTALARSFVQQHRLNEAEGILERCVGSSCAHLPLEEKAEIAHLLSYKDEYINSLLRQSDWLAEGGNFSEALKVYETLFSAIERRSHYYQASPVEKERLRHIVQLRMAELSFCLRDFPRVISSLAQWNTAFFTAPSDYSFLSRRLFLLASAYEHTGDEAHAKALWQQNQSIFSPKIPFLADPKGYSVNGNNESEALLLWKAKNALHSGSSDGLIAIAEVIGRRSAAGHPLPPLLRGLAAAVRFDLPSAVREAQNTLQHPKCPLQKAWKETAVRILAECGFTRMMLLVCSGQAYKAQALGQSILPLLSSSNDPAITLRVAAMYLFLYRQSHEEAHLDKVRSLLHDLKEPVPDEFVPLFGLLSRSVLATQGADDGVALPLPSVSDQFFAEWIGNHEAASVSPQQPQDQTELDDPDPFTRYLCALSMYQHAQSGEESVESAQQALHDCLNLPGLQDVHPHLYHCLIDLAAHNGQPQIAYQLIWELIGEDREYQGLPQAMLTTIFACGTIPELATQRSVLCQYLLNRPTPDIYTLILSLHLLQTPSAFADHNSNRFESALLAQNEGRLLVAEANKSKEPSLIKEQLVRAMAAFDTARQQAIESMPAFHDSASISMLWSFALTTGSEQIELLERHIPSDSAFNELPILLEEATSHLSEDLDELETTLQNHSIQKSFLASCQTLIQTGPIFAHTFRRELDSAIAATKTLTDLPSKAAVRSLLYLSKTLREAMRAAEALQILAPLKEKQMTDDYELALEIAMEKSLCFRDIHKPEKAMALLAWVINGPYVSSLRIKAMILRADLYLLLHRRDLAIRQLISVVAKGGEWGAVAERKLRELYGIN